MTPGFRQTQAGTPGPVRTGCVGFSQSFNPSPLGSLAGLGCYTALSTVPSSEWELGDQEQSLGQRWTPDSPTVPSLESRLAFMGAGREEEARSGEDREVAEFGLRRALAPFLGRDRAQ